MNPNDLPQELAYQVGDKFVNEEDFKSMQRAELDRLYALFTQMRDKWVQARATLTDVEKRWRKNTDLYYGDNINTPNEFENTLRNGPPARKAQDGNRSRVVINIVRPKVDQAISRMCEILFPVDDRNWGLKPTPLPELATMVGNDTPTVDPMTGQPTGLTANDEADAIMQAAKEA